MRTVITALAVLGLAAVQAEASSRRNDVSVSFSPIFGLQVRASRGSDFDDFRRFQRARDAREFRDFERFQSARRRQQFRDFQRFQQQRNCDLNRFRSRR